MKHNSSGTNWGNKRNYRGTHYTDVTPTSNVSLSNGSDGSTVTDGQLQNCL